MRDDGALFMPNSTIAHWTTLALSSASGTSQSLPALGTRPATSKEPAHDRYNRL